MIIYHLLFAMVHAAHAETTRKESFLYVRWICRGVGVGGVNDRQAQPER